MNESSAPPQVLKRSYWIAFGILTLILLRPSIAGIDGQGNYAYAISLVIDHDLDFSNEYLRIDASQEKHYRLSDAPVDPRTERPANRYGPGAALAWLPAVAITHGLLALSDPQRATGLGFPYEVAVALSSALCMGLGLWWLMAQLAASIGWRISIVVVVLSTFATSLFFYGWMHGSMSHAVSFCLAVAMICALDRSWRLRAAWPVFTTGVMAGLLTTTRFQDASWLMVVGGAILFGWPKRKVASGALARWQAAAAFVGGGLCGLAPLLFVWKSLYGSWLAGPLPYLGREAGSWSPWAEHFSQVLISQRGGVFGWHPILAVGFVGLALAPARHRKLGRLLIVGVLAQLYVVSGWSIWWAGDSFGNRFFVSSYPAFAVGLGWLITRIPVRRRMPLLVTAGTFAVIWNAGLFIQYGARIVPRETEVGWPTVINNQVTAVPNWLHLELERTATLEQEDDST